MSKRFFIKRKDFKKLERYAENIYNTAVVIDYYDKKIYLVDLKSNKNFNEFCRKKGVNLQEINCSKCEHYRSRTKILSKICESCTSMPMDKFIQEIIQPKEQ